MYFNECIALIGQRFTLFGLQRQWATFGQRFTTKTSSTHCVYESMRELV
jgi:hypothetical protein